MSLVVTPVPFTHVSLSDPFWAPRIETNRTVTLPAEYDMLRQTGRLAAWAGRWQPGDPNPPHVFWDSDVAKWIEAAAYSLAAHPDPVLGAQLDAAIADLARLQLADGYVNSHYQHVEPGKRWTNLRDAHELYCAGHLIEAAVAHWQATDKRALLDIVCRYADQIDATFGRGAHQRRGYCGHPEIELALVKLYHATGEARYLRLAQYFIDERGAQPHYYDAEARERGEDPAKFWAKTYAYMQALVPVREQREVTGHAVRAMYMVCAMADLAAETSDASLRDACERLWENVCGTQMYLTGGIGQTRANEGFTGAYDLPDETAYAETCAAIGLVCWAQRMLSLSGDGRYADVMERALYNGVASGVALDGARFFYENPLASRGAHHRQAWFDCACCPPNIARLLASVGGYLYGAGEREVWVHLYAQGAAQFEVGGRAVALAVESEYPWDGAVRIAVRCDAPLDFTLCLRVPGWCAQWRLLINGAASRDLVARDGYVRVTRAWRPGDVVDLQLAMPAHYVYGHPAVPQLRGRVALQRGPVVYCLEGADHEFVALDRYALDTRVPAAETFRVVSKPGLLGGVVILHGTAARLCDAGGALYRPDPPAVESAPIVAIPYAVWDNRAAGEMRVWLRTA
ncbi:MAG: glycoside hydrolase family 127 protein [Chloroflexi bacterium]|nr:glycoside hydrolase family 127 protein [Chloroflexota bacterium]